MVKNGEVAQFEVHGCVEHNIPVVRAGVTADGGFDCIVYWGDGSEAEYHLALTGGTPMAEYPFAG